MKNINIDACASIAFRLDWQSENATHTDCYYGQKVNFWRDIFPPQIREALLRQSPGDVANFALRPGEAIPDYDPKKNFEIRSSQFDREFSPDAPVEPRSGRFYPKGMLKDIANVFKANIRPFRCAEVRDTGIRVDFNHPLAGKDLRVGTTMGDIWEKRSDTGGSCTEWLETVAEGPGMQARWKGRKTDFFSDDFFGREDEGPDGRFYVQPRFVNHIDDTAIRTISGLYGELLQPGMKVLDLMSSWTSHLPPDLELAGLTGLGLNEEELRKNPALTDYLVHDLNENPVLPFGDGTYDAAICTVSAEYLIRPFEVFREVNRILKPGGSFIVSFSNRWFSPKAIRIWKDLHEFERMGLITEYFLESGRFTELATYSMRGLPRPEEDKYYSELMFADPVYCVWGRKITT